MIFSISNSVRIQSKVICLRLESLKNAAFFHLLSPQTCNSIIFLPCSKILPEIKSCHDGDKKSWTEVSALHIKPCRCHLLSTICTICIFFPEPRFLGLSQMCCNETLMHRNEGSWFFCCKETSFSTLMEEEKCSIVFKWLKISCKCPFTCT